VKVILSIDVQDAVCLEKIAGHREFRTGWPCHITDVIRAIIKDFIENNQGVKLEPEK